MAVRRLAILSFTVLALLLQTRPAQAQDHATILETRSFPLQNRVRTVIVDEDLEARSHRIHLRARTRVVDNHAEVVARRSPESFDARFRRGARERQAIFDLFERLCR
jgi:hypothetical protein